MNQFQSLKKRAIEQAKNGEWQLAIDTNLEILKDRENDIGTLNRLGYCYVQLDDKQNATKTYEKVLELDRRNAIAEKYLGLLKKNVKIKPRHASSFDDFVEEPRRTKVLSLDRLAGPKVLEELSVATPCLLKPKGRYVCVTTEAGEYIGSLPEDVSRHLSQLIKTGNTYKCLIRSVSKQECWVFIKEKFVSEENKFTPSFLLNNFSDVELTEEVVDPDLELDGDVIDTKDVDIEEVDEEPMGEQLPADIMGSVGEV